MATKNSTNDPQLKGKGEDQNWLNADKKGKTRSKRKPKARKSKSR